MKTTILAVALASIGIHHQSFAEEVTPPSDGQSSPNIAQSTVPTKLDEANFIASDDGGREETGKDWQQAAKLKVSNLGYDAVSLRPPGEEIEGCSDTLIVVGDRVLARIPYAVPVMFSPQGDYLLLREEEADDDQHYFIVDVLGLDRKEVPLQRHLFGNRHTRNLRWSKDGQVIRAGNFNFGPDFSEDYPLAEILGEDALSRAAGVNRPDKETAELTRQALLNQLEVVEKEFQTAKEDYYQGRTWRDSIQPKLVLEKIRQWRLELKRQLAWANRQLAAIKRQEARYRRFMENIGLEKHYFSGTTNGITDEELENLNQKQESENWKITDSRPGRITATNKNGESVVSVQRYPIKSGPENEVAVLQVIHTNNLQAVSTTVMRLSSRPAESFPNVPVVSINEFYAEGDKVADPDKYRGNVVTLLRPDGTLSYDLITKMEDELAGKRKAYDITAFWNGRGFQVDKIELPKPDKD